MKKIVLWVALCVGMAGIAFADAPVVDISAQPEPTPTGTDVSEAGSPVQNMPSPSNTNVSSSPDNTEVAASDEEDDQDVQDTNPDVNGTHFNNNPQPPVIDTSSLPLNDRVSRLESQINNIVRMNMPQQIAELQQQLAQLRGQLQVQAHNLKLLNQQQRTFYQDLDVRIKQLGSTHQPVATQNDTAKPASNVLDASKASVQLKESAVFQGAINFLTSKRYGKAINAFQDYLNTYPQGHYVANAHYWLGDIYFMQEKNALAQKEFGVLVSQFSSSPKVPDAKLKLAIIDANAGNVAKARTEFQKIKQDYPNSTAAQLANIRLQQLNALKN